MGKKGARVGANPEGVGRIRPDVRFPVTSLQLQPREAMPAKGADGSVVARVFLLQPAGNSATAPAFFPAAPAICVAPRAMLSAGRIKSAAGAIKSTAATRFSAAGRG